MLFQNFSQLDLFEYCSFSSVVMCHIGKNGEHQETDSLDCQLVK